MTKPTLRVGLTELSIEGAQRVEELVELYSAECEAPLTDHILEIVALERRKSAELLRPALQDLYLCSEKLCQQWRAYILSLVPFGSAIDTFEDVETQTAYRAALLTMHGAVQELVNKASILANEPSLSTRSKFNAVN